MVTERPLCKCHAEPMVKNGSRKSGRQMWRCHRKISAYGIRGHWERGGRERRRERYLARKDAGACTRCGKPRLSEALCWDCLNEMEARRGICL